VNDKLSTRVVGEGFDFICEVPIHKPDNVKFLPEYVSEDMKAEGLDPLNKDDVKEFWRRKGIVNG
jgi:hypothetical protein